MENSNQEDVVTDVGPNHVDHASHSSALKGELFYMRGNRRVLFLSILQGIAYFVNSNNR